MALAVIEFKEKYPLYNMEILSYNPPTDTELLMHSKMYSLFFELNEKHIYQKFCFNNKVFKFLLNIFKKEGKEYSFEARINNRPILFKGIRRENSIYAVCLHTKERVLLTHHA